MLAGIGQDRLQKIIDANAEGRLLPVEDQRKYNGSNELAKEKQRDVTEGISTKEANENTEAVGFVDAGLQFGLGGEHPHPESQGQNEQSDPQFIRMMDKSIERTGGAQPPRTPHPFHPPASRSGALV